MKPEPMKFETPMTFADVKRIARSCRVDILLEPANRVVPDSLIVLVSRENEIYTEDDRYIGRCIFWG